MAASSLLADEFVRIPSKNATSVLPSLVLPSAALSQGQWSGACGVNRLISACWAKDRSQGPKAFNHAARRVDVALKKGDEDNHIFWRQIAEKVKRELPAVS